MNRGDTPNTSSFLLNNSYISENALMSYDEPG